MDRVAYVAMTGAKHLMHRQEVLANNLANAGTTGFRADIDAATAVPGRGAGLATRAYSVQGSPGANFANGAISRTGNGLDAAIDGGGFFAVQGLDGNEAYTRSGSFARNGEGNLVTYGGMPVLGDGGPIAIPENAVIEIAKDGTVSAATADAPGKPQTLGKLKLVNPDTKDLAKGLDGLFRLRGGDSAPADETVKVAGGSLEGSNVNVVDTLVGMISLAREFEMQMKLLTDTDQNDKQAAAKLLAP
ncbi:MAG: flagellar basal body rod protein FlgF [Betaproteobacteria bacterium]|nr:flagellar basal body rod protein FlgF [Betaproteobacteria bacterium]